MSPPLPAVLSERAARVAGVLVLCAHARPERVDADGLRAALDPAPDWELLLAAGAQHALLPLLHQALQAHAPERVPPPVRAALRQAQMRTAADSLRRRGELQAILGDFAGAGIRALPFKGPILAERLYGGLALRPFNDLDVLVDEGDAPRAAALVARRGYVPAAAPGRRRERARARFDRFIAFERAADGDQFDLHWSLSSRDVPLPLALPDVFPRAATASCGGMEVPVLGDEDLLLFLAVHGSKHQWSRLIWLVDVAELLHGAPVDVAAVLASAGRYRAGRMCALGLHLAHALLGAPLPEPVRDALAADRAVRDLAREVRGRLFRAPAEDFYKRHAFHRARFALAASDTALQRVRRVGWELFRPTAEDWEAAHLPDPLAPLDRVVRPVRLVVRQLRGG